MALPPLSGSPNVSAKVPSPGAAENPVGLAGVASSECASLPEAAASAESEACGAAVGDPDACTGAETGTDGVADGVAENGLANRLPDRLEAFFTPDEAPPCRAVDVDREVRCPGAARAGVAPNMVDEPAPSTSAPITDSHRRWRMGTPILTNSSVIRTICGQIGRHVRIWASRPSRWCTGNRVRVCQRGRKERDMATLTATARALISADRPAVWSVITDSSLMSRAF